MKRVNRTVSWVLTTVLVAVMVLPSTAFGSTPRRLTERTARLAVRKGTASSAASRFVPGEVIVRFRRTATTTQRSTAHATAGGVSARKLGESVPGLTRVKLRAGVSVASAVSAYNRQPGVVYAQPNYVKHIEKTPNDPAYPSLWGMNNTGQTGGTADADIDAPEAWDITTGSGSVKVVVIDTGIDYNHPDLAGNVWTNPGEVAGNNIDDDANGYIDDVHGWDAVNDDGDPMDDHGHGTHVSGTIGAVGNDGTGVVGVNWDVSIVGVKMLDSAGSGTTADEIAAFEYAKTVGAKVISCSWGGYSTTEDPAERDEIASLDALVVCAAGNESNDNDVSSGALGGYHYPSSYALPNILAVGATDSSDAIADFSNRGATSVDLFAPGVGIRSTIPGLQLKATADSLFADDLTSLGGWSLVHVGGTATHPWALTTRRFASPPSSAGNTDYVSDAWDALELKSGLDFSGAGAPGYALKFNTQFDIEDDDTLWIWAGSDQQDWQMVGYGTGSSNGFIPAELDLTGFADDTGVKVSFDMDSYSFNQSATNGEGAYVDDVNIVTKQWTTDYPTAYDTWDGTSMATPHVSGVAALMLAKSPSLTPLGLKSGLMDSVDHKANLVGACVTGGRLNAAKAVGVVSSGTITGVITSTLGGPVAGAMVTSGGKSATSDASGAYILPGVASGVQSLSVSAADFAPQTISNVAVTALGTTVQNVSLAPLPGTVSGVVSDAGLPVAGALVTVGTSSAMTAVDGSFSITGLVQGGYTFSAAGTGYAPVTGSLGVSSNRTTALNVQLSRVVPKASIAKSPSKSSLTYKRKKGVAKYKLSATFKGWNGTVLAGRTVYLQTSKNGKTGWKNTYKLATNSTGKASKSFKVKTKGTRYYRWYAPAKSQMNLKTYASKQKVVVK